MAKKNFDTVDAAEVKVKSFSLYGAEFDFSDWETWGAGVANATQMNYYFPIDATYEDFVTRCKAPADSSAEEVCNDILENAIRETLRNRANEKPKVLTEEEKKNKILDLMRKTGMTMDDVKKYMDEK